MDERIRTLARNLVNYSVRLKTGEKILIEQYDGGSKLTQALIEEASRVGALPFVIVKHNATQRIIYKNASKQQMEIYGQWEATLMNQMDAYIAVRAYDNMTEMADVSSESMELYQKYWWKIVHTDSRLKNTKWCVLRYPTASMAQSASMSTEAFEDFYFKVCNLDYAKMAEAQEPLVKLMQQTDKVHIKGPGTDLEFSIKNIPVVKCCGLRNIPDGEVYSAPVKDSVNGIISYNTPSIQQGTTYENVRFEFENGKIIKATANYTDKINKLLDTDEGARYIGEFALGLNPFVDKPMKDTLFDEKIAGSFHFTPGNAYEHAFNGNRSAIHWDLVCIQTPEYGGGEIYFDGRLIRKDGRFVLPELQLLNPEHLGK